MSRVLSRLALLLAFVGICMAAEPSVDEYVQIFNPDLYAGKDAAPMESTFTNPGSDIAKDVLSYFWFATLVFLPFLILPQILLLYIIFKFKDRKDGRKSATWVHNTRLEIAWTAIPVLTLIIVGIPVFPLLYKMEQPPEGWEERALQITVIGKQFSWAYEYKKEGVQLGLDLVSAHQDSVVLPKGQPALLSITSNDVNHAWWIPAFGVKKDAIIGRYNSVWFTPDRTGFFKGQCAELCGPNHGAMIIGAVVVEPDQFKTWVAFQKQRVAAQKVWTAALAWQKKGDDEGALREAIAGYREKAGANQQTDLALRYWMAHNAASYARKDPGGKKDSAEFQAWKSTVEAMTERKDKVGEILATFTAMTNPEAHLASIQE